MTPPSGRRSATPVIGNILLVAVVLVIAITLTVLSFAFLDGLGAPTAEATFEYEQTSAGLVMRPEVIGTDVAVKLNGEQVTTFEADAAGQSVLLPTAPGDRITVVSRDGEQSVLVSKTIDDRSEVGDFIAYYTFDQGSGKKVVDRSGNGNHGTATGGFSRGSDAGGTYMQFDGQSGTYVDMGNMALRGPSVEEITIAIEYRKNFGTSGCSGINCIQNLVEHQASSFAWFFETDRNYPSDPHRMQFNIGYNTGSSANIVTGDIPEQTRQVLVGTYDGDKMVFYRNGNRVGSKSLDRPVELGQVIVAADSNPSIQNFKGRIYEFRLYYTAMSSSEVDVLTEAMSDG